MTKKPLTEQKLLEGLTPFNAHADALATTSARELGVDFTEYDYKRALMRIKVIFDAAEQDTPEGDELEKLASLVEEYEDKNYLV
jgi:HTH-type transcriptional regulator/antitoxin HigA